MQADSDHDFGFRLHRFTERESLDDALNELHCRPIVRTFGNNKNKMFSKEALMMSMSTRLRQTGYRENFNLKFQAFERRVNFNVPTRFELLQSRQSGGPEWSSV